MDSLRPMLVGLEIRKGIMSKERKVVGLDLEKERSLIKKGQTFHSSLRFSVVPVNQDEASLYVLVLSRFSIVPVNQEEAFWYVKNLHEQEKGVDQGHETEPSRRPSRSIYHAYI